MSRGGMGTQHNAGKDPWIGRTIAGKYEIVSRLGSGGMGTVYRCKHSLLPGRDFALKLLHPEMSANTKVRARFLREGEVLLGLNHSSIVAVRDLGLTDDGQIYLCLDFCEGVLLSEVLERRKRLAPADALRITEMLLEGLAVAHRAGVIHRDLKPENIMVGAGAKDQLSVRILDFGIAHLSDADATDLTQGMIIGTPRYMSPEQAWGEEIDARSDLYSVGLILFEMLAGRPAVDGKSTREVIQKHRAARIESVAKHLDRHPWTEPLERLFQSIFTRDRCRRLESAELFREQLVKIRRLESGDPKPWLKKAAAVLVLAGILGGGWYWIESGLPGHAAESEAAPDAPGGTPEAAPVEVKPAPAPQETPKAEPHHRCSICGYRATAAGVCPFDGVRLRPVAQDEQ